MQSKDVFFLVLVPLAALLILAGTIAAQEPAQPVTFYSDKPAHCKAQRVNFPSSLYPYSEGMTLWACVGVK